MSTASSSDPWVYCRLPRPQARQRLFCFPYAGGGVSVFHAWPNELPIETEVCALLYPGRERRHREPAITRMDTLASEVTEALLPWLDRPFACFGHSLGALVAFEVVRRLRRQHGLLPRFLFAAGSGAPQLPAIDAPIHSLPDDDLVCEVDRRYGGIPATVRQDPELLKFYLPAIRADFAILESYQYVEESPLPCPITAFGGEEDSQVARSRIEPWREQSHGPFQLHMLPGDHFFLQSARTQLLQAIAYDLAR